MTSLVIHPPRAQPDQPNGPYDRWMSPNGDCLAEFYRADGAFLMRFPGEADFRVMADGTAVEAWPSPNVAEALTQKLFQNSVLPTLGNHMGGLFLHGSAVVIEDKAVAFLGHSRSGKTTLAGAFAKAGNPFLTEDVIELVALETGYELEPKPSALRLFPDSAAHLLGRPIGESADWDKDEVHDPAALPFADKAAPLAGIFVLGSDDTTKAEARRLSHGEALPALLEHAFVLDVEDKARMKAHFSRLADLVEAIPVHRIEYPRDYSALPSVLETIRTAAIG